MAAGRECDLCSLGCGKHPLRQRVADADRYFCCIGCMNVFLILWESGAIRAGQDIRQTELFQRSLQLGLISNPAREDANPRAVDALDGAREELLLHVSGMWCTSCAWLIEHALAALPGVAKAEASFASDLVKVQYHPQILPPERIVSRIASLGYKAQRDAGDSDAAGSERRDLIIRTGLAAFLWANVMSFSLALYAGYFEQISGSVRRGLPFVLMALATPVVFYCAQPILRLAWRGLLNRTLRMESLLALGILAAYGYSVVQAFRGEIHLYFDTATIIVVLVLAGKLIEHGAKEKVSRWISLLHRMMPNKVRLLAKGSERFVSVDALDPGEVFMVKAGERIPADGIVVEGESHADESLLTGESVPVSKRPGESVAAGSVNLDGVLSVRATKSAGDSTLSRIITLVEQALSSRCDIERVVDRVSRIFVPSVVLVALLTFFFTWITGTASLAQSLMRAVTVLVIACPCALGLATPLAITAAFGAASRRGILIRDSRVLETLRKIDTVILDKTGTVTEGKFSLLELVPYEPCAQPVPAEAAAAITSLVNGFGKGTASAVPPRASAALAFSSHDEALFLLASLEQYSEHPLGRAVAEFARQQGTTPPEASALEIHKGRGITGIVGDNHVFGGNRRLVKELGVAINDSADAQARAWEEEGKTVSFVGWDGELRALAAFGDKLKPEAIELAAELKRRGVAVHLVSGDARATTTWVASRLGTDSSEAEVLPEEKVGVVRRLQQNGATVAMVGDGINDAPALAQADLGIAMGSGTDIAIEAAAVVLMSGSLNKILDVLRLSQRTMRFVRQNLFWAFFYNSVGITLAVAGLLNPIMAAAAMLLSSLSVVANSMRLAREEI
ncbi:MAG: heavy metal translocating P-type ATPase [Candidatus Sulfotelmatobacter sp.]